MPEPRKRIAILGGGMAGLSAAWRLSRPEGPRPEITVYQRGWRLGGKGASHRGPNGRIEEHGLHVWLGYYENAFRLMRACYEELDRPRTDLESPIKTWQDAFVRSSTVGLIDDQREDWRDFIALFPENKRVPGDEQPPRSFAERLQHGVSMFAQMGTALRGEPLRTQRVVMSTRPVPPVHPTSSGVSGLLSALAGMAETARAASQNPRAPRIAARFVDLWLAIIRALGRDQVLERGIHSIDHLDFGEWLLRHGGAAPDTLQLSVLRGLADLVFGYEEGDRSRPRFAAGVGLELWARFFLDYSGAIFWKMQAGMGEIVFAPLYEALRRRGVRFEFFHRLDDLHVDADGESITAVTLGRQVAIKPGIGQYHPLVRVKGLPVFPSVPDLRQLDAGPELLGHDLEFHGVNWPDAGTVRLEAGRDFDALVLAVSVGMVPHTCAELLERSERWRAMTRGIGTVATQSLQLWLRPDERELGWLGPAPVMTGAGGGFDTFASMSHLLAREEWPAHDQPRTAATFCSVLPEATLRGRSVEEVRRAVRDEAVRFMEERVRKLWPNMVDGDGRLRWELLSGAANARGPEAFASQYWRANIDPSDRYVQSLPGTDALRLRACDSGFWNLILAGDWIDSGLNAGCIEAAVLSGLQAANAVEGRTLTEGTSGWTPTHGGAP